MMVNLNYNSYPQQGFVDCWIHIRGELTSWSICTSMYKIEFQITHLLFSYFWCLIRRLTMWHLFKIERIPILKIIFSWTIHKHLCVTHLLWEIMYIVNAQKSFLQISDQSFYPLSNCYHFHFFFALATLLTLFVTPTRKFPSSSQNIGYDLWRPPSHRERERERAHGL